MVLLVCYCLIWGFLPKLSPRPCARGFFFGNGFVEDGLCCEAWMGSSNAEIVLPPSSVIILAGSRLVCNVQGMVENELIILRVKLDHAFDRYFECSDPVVASARLLEACALSRRYEAMLDREEYLNGLSA